MASTPLTRRRDVRDTERADVIADLRKSGWTLQQIGRAFDLSRERVRQIIFLHSPDLRGWRVPAVEAPDLRALLALPVVYIEDTTTAQRKQLRKLGLGWKLQGGRSAGAEKIFSKELCLAAMRQCLEETGKITVQAYSTWRKNTAGRPAAVTIQEHGYWFDLAQELGVTLRYVAHNPRIPERMTAKQLLDHLREYVHECIDTGVHHTSRGFYAWSNSQGLHYHRKYFHKLCPGTTYLSAVTAIEKEIRGQVA